MLVNESGDTLKEIVSSVKRVTEMISDIAEASMEQSAGIEQVNKAITQMDEMTQQNAALVEQASAAGESMSEQANDMRKLLNYFSMNESDSIKQSNHTPAPMQEIKSPIIKKSKPEIEHLPQSNKASTKNKFVDSSDEWEEF